MPAGKLRHKDHRFEWSRAEFQSWANSIAERFGYSVRFLPIGPEDPASEARRRWGFSGNPMRLTIPELAVVALVGPSGSGKSRFARKHFRPNEVLSSDFCRGLVSDDENNQAATNDASEVLYFIASKRFEAGKLVVIDATNVQPEARKPIIALAREYHCLPVAIIFDLPEKLCHERNRDRPDRTFGPHVIRQQADSCGVRSAFSNGRLPPAFMSCIRRRRWTRRTIDREPLWNNLKYENGPFDIIGDIHGCFDEFIDLLTQLGYSIEPSNQW